MRAPCGARDDADELCADRVDPADHLYAGKSWTGYGIYEASQLAMPISFLEFSREFEAEADWLGLQYMYKAGYDPQAFIQFFEKIDALEKHKPGDAGEGVRRPSADAGPDCALGAGDCDDHAGAAGLRGDDQRVRRREGRLARIENKRKLNDKSNGNKPTLRRVGGSNNDPNTHESDTSDDQADDWASDD